MVGVDEGICQLVPLLGGVELFVGVGVDMGGVSEESSHSFNVEQVHFMVRGEMLSRVSNSLPERTGAHEFDILLETKLEFQGALHCRSKKQFSFEEKKGIKRGGARKKKQPYSCAMYSYSPHTRPNIQSYFHAVGLPQSWHIVQTHPHPRDPQCPSPEPTSLHFPQTHSAKVHQRVTYLGVPGSTDRMFHQQDLGWYRGRASVQSSCCSGALPPSLRYGVPQACV